MSRPKVAALTLAHGRHRHLAAHLDALRAGTRRPDLIVVAAMDDRLIADIVTSAAGGAHRGDGDGRRSEPSMHTVSVPRVNGHLTLATARNLTAERAIRDGAELLVFLDVDCIASPGLVQRYVEAHADVAAVDEPDCAPAVLSGAVHYLPPLQDAQTGYAADDLAASAPHPARPVAPDGSCVAADDVLLFWSLSFAVGVQDWVRLGGFEDDYRGYGGEDTDFAMRLKQAGGRLFWVGGAPAYHQHHEVEEPPRRHLTDIVRNSNQFHDRWGFFPMRGWLAAFEADGLVTLSGRPPRWSLTSAGRSAARSA